MGCTIEKSGAKMKGEENDVGVHHSGRGEWESLSEEVMFENRLE